MELLMGCWLRTALPQMQEQLTPDWQHLEQLHHQDITYKQQQKQNFDQRLCSCPLPELPDSTPVLVRTEDWQIPGTVSSRVNAPRSYLHPAQSHHDKVTNWRSYPSSWKTELLKKGDVVWLRTIVLYNVQHDHLLISKQYCAVLIIVCVCSVLYNANRSCGAYVYSLMCVVCQSVYSWVFGKLAIESDHYTFLFASFLSISLSLMSALSLAAHCATLSFLHDCREWWIPFTMNWVAVLFSH